MTTEENQKKQIEQLHEKLKKKHEETAILHAIMRALKKLQEKRGTHEEKEHLNDLEEKLKNL